MEIKSSITRNIENRELHWYEHVERMPEDRWPKKMMEWTPQGKRRQGRPTTKCKTGVLRMIERNLQEGGLLITEKS